MSRSLPSAPARVLIAGLVVLVASVGCTSVTPPTPGPQVSGVPSAAPPTVSPATPAQPTATSAPTSSPEQTPAGPTPAASPTPAATAGPATPGPTVEPALAAQIDAVTVQIPPIRQLEATAEVPYEFITREQFRSDLLETVFEDQPPEWLAAEQRFLQRIGMLPADADLTQMLVDLYGAQVAAYYRPETGRFYIIQRDQPFGPTDKVTVSHEYTHALQDQHFDLEGSRIKDLTEGDAAIAQLSVIEGDATLTSQQWMIDNLTPQEQLQLLGEALGQLDENLLEGMPLILRRQLEFPYVEGFLFASDIYGLGGYEAVNQAIETPPLSTEQILHSQKYYDQEAPVDVTLDDASAALGAGWSRVYEQTLGELNTQIFTTGGDEPPNTIPGLPVEWPHAEAAAGWGGDRAAMYEGPNGAWAIEWKSAWDTPVDMQEFATRAGELLFNLGSFSKAAPGDAATNEYVIWLASDQATLDLISAQ